MQTQTLTALDAASCYSYDKGDTDGLDRLLSNTCFHHQTDGRAYNASVLRLKPIPCHGVYSLAASLALDGQDSHKSDYDTGGQAVNLRESGLQVVRKRSGGRTLYRRSVHIRLCEHMPTTANTCWNRCALPSTRNALLVSFSPSLD